MFRLPKRVSNPHPLIYLVFRKPKPHMVLRLCRRDPLLWVPYETRTYKILPVATYTLAGEPVPKRGIEIIVDRVLIHGHQLCLLARVTLQEGECHNTNRPDVDSFCVVAFIANDFSV